MHTPPVMMDKSEQTASMKTAMTGKGWKLEDISICPAENGWTVKCSKKRDSKKGMSDYRTKNYVFESKAAALAHVEALMDGEDPKGDYGDEEE